MNPSIVSTITQVLRTSLPTIMRGIGTGVTSIIGAFKLGAGKTKEAFEKIVPALTFFRAILKDVINTLSNFAEEVQKVQKMFGVNVSNSAKLQLEALESSMNSIFAVFDQFGTTDVSKVLTDVFSSFTTAGSSIFNDVMGGVFTPTKFLGTLKDTFSSTLNALRTAAETQTADITNIALGPGELLKSRATIQEEFGVIPTREIGDEYARFAKFYGVSIETLVKARRSFSTILLGDLSKTDQLRDQIVAKFKQQNISQKIALEQIVKYSEIFARNGLRFADSFVRAAADAKKIGVDLAKVDQIGDNIIDNFEGFLEKQAELGAMGFNFDTSRLAELAETGDTGALFRELRSELAMTGKDITKLRRSERLALESAFGINISDMLKMAGVTPKEKTSEDLLNENNSVLGQILAILEASKILLGIMGTALSFTIMGYLAKMVMSLDSITDFFSDTNKKVDDAVKRGDVGGAMKEGMIKEAINPTNLIGGALAGLTAAFLTGGAAIPFMLGGAALGSLGGGLVLGPTWGIPAAEEKNKQFEAGRPAREQARREQVAREAVERGKEYMARQQATQPVKKATGGFVSGPGTQTSDSIPARLSNGEYVLNAKAVSLLGVDTLNKLNNIPKLATGGLVGTVSSLLQSKGLGLLSGKLPMLSNMYGIGAGGLKSNLLGTAGSFLSGKVPGLSSSINAFAQGGIGGLKSNLVNTGLGFLGGKVPGLSGAMSAFSAFKEGGVKGALGSLAKGGIGKAIGGAIGTAIPIPGVGTMIGSVLGSKIGKFAGGLFGKKKGIAAPMGMESVPSPDLSMMLGSQEPVQQTSGPQQAPIVDTSGIEQKLNNFINALQNIQINMDGNQVGKVLVKTSEAAASRAVFRTQAR